MHDATFIRHLLKFYKHALPSKVKSFGINTFIKIALAFMLIM